MEQPMRSPKLGLGSTEETPSIISDFLHLIKALKLSRAGSSLSQAFPSPQKMRICASSCSFSRVPVSLDSQLFPAETNLSEFRTMSPH